MKKTIKLTNIRVMRLRNALNMLDGYQKLAPDGKSTVPEHFKFGSDKIRLRIAQNQNSVDAACTVIDKAQKDLMREIMGANVYSIDPEKNPRELAEFSGRSSDMLDEEIELTVHTIPVDQLNLGDNPIPSSALAELMSAGIIAEPADDRD